MSKKSSKGPNKVALPKPPPRQIDVISKEYQETSLRAGQIQYQIFVHQRELDMLNDKMIQLNYEGAERNQLNTKEQQPESTEGSAT